MNGLAVIPRATRAECVTLADGAEVELRALERSDRGALASAMARLSDRTRYLRFASPKPTLNERELDALTQLDRHNSDALLAIERRTGDVVGVARFAAVRGDPGAVDVAVTVGDRWQGRGLGTSLVARLIDRARAERHRTVRATVLAENARSIAMLRRAGFVTRPGSGALREFELALTQPPRPLETASPVPTVAQQASADV